MVAISLPLLICLYLSVKGWDWLRGVPFGSYGFFFKLIGVMFVAATGIGLLAVLFWAGRFICRKSSLFTLELD